MDKKKAQKLDRILKSLVMNKDRSKTEIEARLNESVKPREFATIISHQHNGNNIVTAKTENGKFLYRLTKSGGAFVEDEGFLSIFMKESRQRRNENINLSIAILSFAVAVGALIFSMVQSKSQSSQYESLKHRIDQIEKSNE